MYFLSPRERYDTIKKTTLLFFILFVLCLNLNAQERQGYIKVNDTTNNQGLRIAFNISNPVEVRSIFENKTFLSYTADDILEFGFGNKTRFVSRHILYNNKLQNVFLELLVDGEVSLLRLGRGKGSQLFLETDDLMLLNQDNYQEILSAHTKACEKWVQQVKLINYSIPSIRYVIQELNAKNCERLPFTSYGITVGYNSSQMTIENRLLNPILVGDFNMNASGISLALFIEKPLWGLKNMSVLGNFTLFHNNFQGSQSESRTRPVNGRGGRITTDVQREINVKTSYISIDIAPKYNFSFKRLQFYLSLGASVGQSIDFKDELLTTTRTSFTGRTTTDFNPDFIPSEELLLGHTYTAGIQFAYRYNRYISLEFKRYKASSGDLFTITNNIIGLKFNL